MKLIDDVSEEVAYRDTERPLKGVSLKMERLKQWYKDINAAQSKVTYDFVFVDEEGLKKYNPKTFNSLVNAFQQYKEAGVL